MLQRTRKTENLKCRREVGLSTSIRYRADIDGLRTVAVLSVLFFHIDHTWVPGGYTGVDIFFVISGFLITRIIATDIEKGRFSLRWFYVRRIRRILPVFYTVTLVTMLAGYVLLLLTCPEISYRSELEILASVVVNLLPNIPTNCCGVR